MNRVISFFRGERIPEILLMVYFFFLPPYRLVSIIALILLTIYIIFSGKIIRSLKILRYDIVLLIPVLYYLLHVTGMFYTVNVDYGKSDLMTKLSFVLVPVIFAGVVFDERLFERIRRSFVNGCLVALVILFGISLKYYLQTGDVYEFFYSRLSHHLHPTYITVYFTLAILFLSEDFFKERKKAWYFFITVLFLFSGIFLLSARTSTVVAIAVFVFYPFFMKVRTVRRNKWYWFVGTIGVMVFLFKSFLSFSNRFEQVKSEIAQHEDAPVTLAPENEKPNSTNIRMHIWSSAVQVIYQHPIFGVGTGDLKEELVKSYEANNYEYGVEHRVSPHNQILHTGVILGFAGIFVLLAMFIASMLKAYDHQDWVFLLFIMAIFLNCMTESMLEREAGILFFTTFNTCFYLRRNNG